MSQPFGLWRRYAVPVAVLGVAALPVAAAIAASADGYVPTGDDAVLAVRALDVLDGNSPSLGMPSGSGAWTGVNSHHPGPLLFWAYAPGVALFGAATGLLVSVAAIVVASIVGIAWTAHRQGGRSAALLALAATAVVYLTLGADLLYRPLNPIAVLLPFLWFLFLTWAVAGRDLVLVPLWAAVGSLVVQADLAYVPAVAGLALGVFVHLVRTDDSIAATSHARRRRRLVVLGSLAAELLSVVVLVVFESRLWLPVLLVGAGVVAQGVALWPLVARWAVRRWVLATAVVALGCWVLPLLELRTGDLGNAGDLIRSAQQPIDVRGLGDVDNAINQILPPPLLSVDGSWPGGWLIAGGLVGLWAVVIAGVHRTSASGRCLLGVAVGSVTAGVVAAALVPVAAGITLAYYHWLVAVSVFLVFAVLWAVRERGGPPAWIRRPLPIAVLVAATIPSIGSAVLQAWPIDDLGSDPWIVDAVRPLADQAREGLDHRGPVEVAASGGPNYRILENGIIASLVFDDVEVRTATLTNYYGDERSVAAGDADQVLWIVPADLEHPPEGARLVGTYRPPGWDQAAVESVAERVQRAVGDDVLVVPEGVQDDAGLSLFGRLPDICAVERGRVQGCTPGAEALATHPTGEDLPAMALLDLYRAGYAPLDLEPDLVADIDEVYGDQAVDLWLGPA